MTDTAIPVSTPDAATSDSGIINKLTSAPSKAWNGLGSQVTRYRDIRRGLKYQAAHNRYVARNIGIRVANGDLDMKNPTKPGITLADFVDLGEASDLFSQFVNFLSSTPTPAQPQNETNAD